MEDVWKKAILRYKRLVSRKIDLDKLTGHEKKKIEKYYPQIYTFFFLDNEGKTALELLAASGRYIAFAEGCRDSKNGDVSRYVYVLAGAGFFVAVDPGHHGTFWVESSSLSFKEAPKFFPLTEEEAVSAFVLLTSRQPEEFLGFLKTEITRIAEESAEYE